MQKKTKYKSLSSASIKMIILNDRISLKGDTFSYMQFILHSS